MAVLKFRVDADGGWCDAQSGEPVPEHQIKARYEPTLLKHSGIRLLEPELFDDYDPHRKMFLRAVALQHDVGPLEVSEAEAQQFVRQHGADKCAAWKEDDGEQWFVLLRRGAVLYVPKALRFDRFVAGQVAAAAAASDDGDVAADDGQLAAVALTAAARHHEPRPAGGARGGGGGGRRAAGLPRGAGADRPVVRGDRARRNAVPRAAAQRRRRHGGVRA